MRRRPLVSHFIKPAGQFDATQIMAALNAQNRGVVGPKTRVGFTTPYSPPASFTQQIANTVTAACALPLNAQVGMVKLSADGRSGQQSRDPYFVSAAARASWIASHAGCPAPPPWVPDQVVALGASPTCSLPTNPRAALVGVTAADGTTLTAVDPYFATGAQRDAWALANPSCSVPSWSPDVVTGGGLPMAAWVGIGLAGVGVLGGLAYLLMPKPKGSRRSSARRNPSRRRTRHIRHEV